jgi:hypothetical protein
MIAVTGLMVRCSPIWSIKKATRKEKEDGDVWQLLGNSEVDSANQFMPLQSCDNQQ